MSERKTPILLRRAPLSGEIMALYRYTRKNVRGREMLDASGKQSVTSDFYSIMLEELIDNGCEDIIGILDGAADGQELDADERAQARIFRERLKKITIAHNERMDAVRV